MKKSKMAAEVASNSVEEESLKRRERLKALRKKSGLQQGEEVSNLFKKVYSFCRDFKIKWVGYSSPILHHFMISSRSVRQCERQIES